MHSIFAQVQPNNTLDTSGIYLSPPTIYTDQYQPRMTWFAASLFNKVMIKHHNVSQLIYTSSCNV